MVILDYPAHLYDAAAARGLVRGVERGPGRAVSRPPERTGRPPRRDHRRTAGARSGGAARHSPGSIRALREEAGQSVIDRAGTLSHERLLGADPVRFPERDSEGLR